MMKSGVGRRSGDAIRGSAYPTRGNSILSSRLASTAPCGGIGCQPVQLLGVYGCHVRRGVPQRRLGGFNAERVPDERAACVAQVVRREPRHSGFVTRVRRASASVSWCIVTAADRRLRC